METKEKKKLKELNEKRNPNAIVFCIRCDLEEGIYCTNCATKQGNKLKKFN